MKRIGMKKVWEYTRFVLVILCLIVAYRVASKYGRTIMGRDDESMDPAVRPGGWVWFNRYERRASQLRNGDIIVYRHPVDQDEIYVAKVAGVPGETINERFLPRGYVWVLLNDKKKKPDSRSFGPLHEHFILGKSFLLNVIPVMAKSKTKKRRWK